MDWDRGWRIHFLKKKGPDFHGEKETRKTHNKEPKSNQGSKLTDS